MTKEAFLEFVKQTEAEWGMALRKEHPALAAFLCRRGKTPRSGKFFNFDVAYFDADEWTY